VSAEKRIMWGEVWQITAVDGEVELRQSGLEPSCSNMEMGKRGRKKDRKGVIQGVQLKNGPI